MDIISSILRQFSEFCFVSFFLGKDIYKISNCDEDCDNDNDIDNDCNHNISKSNHNHINNNHLDLIMMSITTIFLVYYYYHYYYYLSRYCFIGDRRGAVLVAAGTRRVGHAARARSKEGIVQALARELIFHYFYYFHYYNFLLP